MKTEKMKKELAEKIAERARGFEVDEEFKALFAPLSDEEFALLEKSIVACGGPREPLQLCDIGSNNLRQILCDGHNRLAICEKHSLPYSTKPRWFPDRDAAKAWILQNQLGRRNLTDNSLYLGRLYELTKGQKSGVRSQKPGDTAKKLAEKHNVSERAVRYAGKLAQAVEKLKKIEPDIEKKLQFKGITKRDALEAAKFAEKDPEKAKKILFPVKAGAGFFTPGCKPDEMRPFAEQMADEAIAKLKKIPLKDPRRHYALKRVSEWCCTA